MALEVLGMVVNEVEKIRHEFAKRQIRAETCYDGQ